MLGTIESFIFSIVKNTLVGLFNVNIHYRLKFYKLSVPGQFKVLEYLETKDGMPVANYLLLESSLYPDHYLRWYEADGKVDCQVRIAKKYLICHKHIFLA